MTIVIVWGKDWRSGQRGTPLSSQDLCQIKKTVKRQFSTISKPATYFSSFSHLFSLHSISGTLPCQLKENMVMHQSLLRYLNSLHLESSIRNEAQFPKHIYKSTNLSRMPCEISGVLVYVVCTNEIDSFLSQNMLYFPIIWSYFGIESQRSAFAQISICDAVNLPALLPICSIR